MSIHTFSIVAHCPEENAWGVAVASKFPAVGAVVPWARAGVGAVATQSYAKLGFGPDGLALMNEGLSAADALSRLLEADEGRETRQVALVWMRGAMLRRIREASATIGPVIRRAPDFRYRAICWRAKK